MRLNSLIACVLIFLGVGNYSNAQDDSVRLNEIRILASHNSYKKKPDPKVIKFLSRFKKRLGGDLDPIQLDYGHLPIPQQFDEFFIRGLELDIYNDPKGGHYAKRKVNLFLSGKKQRVKDPLMHEPGLKMLHIADVDYESHYATVDQAFETIRQWSLSHPSHEPIFINIEAKGSSPGDYSGFLRFIGFKKAIPFDDAAIQLLDNKIMEFFGKDSILYRPSNLRGEFTSIKQRLDSVGWPLLEEVRGKIFFLFDSDHHGEYNASINEGLDRPMFAYGELNGPSTAFVVKNDPIGHEEEIRQLTEKYMVRTRTDAGSLEARANDYSKYEAAMYSNAQIISTDYYLKDSTLSDFQVSLQGAGLKNSQPFILKD